MLKVKGFTALALGTCLAMSAANISAVPISGTIDLGGPFTPLDASDAAVTDLTQATQLRFNAGASNALVLDATGTFAEEGLEFGDTGHFNDFSFDPLNVSGSYLWSVGGFEFELSTLSVTQQEPGFLDLVGFGVVRGNGYDDTEFSWYYSGQGTQGKFSFSSTSAPVSEPATLALLGLGLAGFGLSRARKAA